MLSFESILPVSLSEPAYESTPYSPTALDDLPSLLAKIFGVMMAPEDTQEGASAAATTQPQTGLTKKPSSNKMERGKDGNTLSLMPQPTQTLSRSLQSKLLKQINALSTKDELLSYVERCHHLLDVINLVTCLYRLARIYSFTQIPTQKASWRSELLSSFSFSMLLGSIQTHLLQAQALLSNQSNTPGLNARCLSNLIWALVKLEATADDGHSMALQVVNTASPLVLHFLSDSSGQGLSNLLWSYAKIPTQESDVMVAIVQRMVVLLQEPASSGTLDAQALSNSIWAIAHVSSKPNDLEGRPEWQEAVTTFLLLMANQCLALLRQLMSSSSSPSGQAAALTQANKRSNAEGTFSCQAIVNIAWSLSTIAGSACGVEEPMRPLFLLIRQLVIAKLQSINNGGLQLHQAWIHSLSGSFNEQALSNLVYSYDKAGLLSAELLQAVLDCSALKLAHTHTTSHMQSALGFKPQELCTLLRACHLGLARPWVFLSVLNRLVVQFPACVDGWNTSELADLARALQLLHAYNEMQGNSNKQLQPQQPTQQQQLQHHWQLRQQQQQQHMAHMGHVYGMHNPNMNPNLVSVPSSHITNLVASQMPPVPTPQYFNAMGRPSGGAGSSTAPAGYPLNATFVQIDGSGNQQQMWSTPALPGTFYVAHNGMVAEVVDPAAGYHHLGSSGSPYHSQL